MSTLNNTQNLDIPSALQELAMGLPVDAIKAPDMPIETALKELKGFVGAGREHLQALSAVGLPAALVDTLEQRTLALEQAQVAWDKLRNQGRGEGMLKIIAEGETLRGDVLAAADLALRSSLDGQRRLANIREGEGLDDLALDLLELAALVQDGAELFSAINQQPEALATQLGAAHKALSEGLAKEHSARSLSIAKELRDRYYSLTLEPLRELRAFADFAFRKDQGNNRRFAFTSAYTRRMNRRYQRKLRSQDQPVLGPVA